MTKCVCIISHLFDLYRYENVVFPRKYYGVAHLKLFVWCVGVWLMSHTFQKISWDSQSKIHYSFLHFWTYYSFLFYFFFLKYLCIMNDRHMFYSQRILRVLLPLILYRFFFVCLKIYFTQCHTKILSTRVCVFIDVNVLSCRVFVLHIYRVKGINKKGIFKLWIC